MRIQRKPLSLAYLALAASAAWAHDSEEAVLHASDAAADDGFGRSLDVAHHDLIGGAPGADVVGTDSGAAYVFVEDPVLGWVEVQKLVPDLPLDGDQFGTAVAIHGSMAAVGAPYHDASGTDSGAVYVFEELVPGVWTQTDVLLPPPGSDGAGFGSALHLTHQHLVVGSPQNLGPVHGNGAAYVYTETAGVFSLEATLTASDGASGHLFGQSVTSYRDMVAVGATKGTGVAAGTGAAYVFEGVGGVWSQTAKVFASDSKLDDFFGVSVSLFQGKVLAIGAPGNDKLAPNGGAAYVFQLKNGVWTAGPTYRSSGSQDLFGGSVAYSYRVLISGARQDDDTAEDAGSAIMYYDNSPFPFGLQIWISSEGEVGELLGAAVDVDECIIGSGAPGHDDGAGAIYIFEVTTATTTPVNGSGVNPSVLATDPLTPPVLGTTWTIHVDASTTPNAGVVQLFGVHRLLPFPVSLEIGEILIHRGSGVYFNLFQATSGVATFDIPIPDDPWLIGQDVQLQAVIRRASPGIPALTLTNAETNRLGCHAD